MTKKKKQNSIGQILVKSLTSEQIAGLLTIVSASTDLNIYMEKFAKTDPDMAATVKKIMAVDQDPASRAKSGRLTSLQRTMEHWHALWGNYDDIISDVGDEEGKYAVQDHHWEEPYFDGSSLAMDLEPIAKDMLTLMEDVYEEVDDPDLFLDALEEIVSRIDSYPEWMGAGYGEPCGLEKKMTRCVLKWLWLSSQYEKNPGRIFAQKAFDLENTFNMVALDEDELTTFFIQLPDGVCREIYGFLSEGDHQIDLDNTYSAWHNINHNYEERFDGDKYIETCRKHLAENWRYGLPLVDEALKQNDFQKAESFLVKTFSSYLKGHVKKKWYPEVSLLLTETDTFAQKGEEEIASLLTRWADVAKRLNSPDRRAAATFQAVTFHTPENWNKVLKAYRGISKSNNQETLALLFAQWKNEMAARSYPYYLDPPNVTDTWIHWLIEAKLNVKRDKKWFLNKLAEWLADLKDNKKTVKKQWRWLALLTRDLPQSEKIKVKHPAFWEAVLHEDDYDGDLTTTRRKGLREMKTGVYFNTALEVWQKQLRFIVPDPANAHKANYEAYAQWAQALFELNRAEYNILISHWRKKHNRRRNLWRDMKARHLPVG